MSRLADLIQNCPPTLADMAIAGIASDSRDVGPGYLFAALPGSRRDGRVYIDQAVDNGAAIILAPKGTYSPVPLLVSDDPRRELALMASRLAAKQPRTVAAVTGTAGKTSTAWFVRAIWTELGKRAGYLGTLGLYAPDVEPKYSLTTPDPVTLSAELKALADAGVDHLALEASSHGIDQRRLDGVTLTAAAFTNLGRDHLDYHRDMDGYFEAKARLFETLLPGNGTAVIHAGSEWGQKMIQRAKDRGLKLITYGTPHADLALISRQPAPGGQKLDISVFGKFVTIQLPVAGTFQADNALAALGLVIACGGDADAATDALNRLPGVPGRMQTVGSLNGAPVIVDYAHKPDALASVLEGARPMVSGRLIVIVGCGGDRDAGKRPIMGEIAARLADIAIITDDNPRSEDPATIRAAVLAGCNGPGQAAEIGDRRVAIQKVIEDLKAGDMLVIAGKGHESGQIVGFETLPFNDAEVAQDVIRSLGGEVRA
ncbi:UDP-N-acetylmuramoyl-L-alanyl-D-glutamate--2,6-diaminopimelate ligase [Lacibacterium aquatile]|uniref:UDP-N-acetylmuramoyl-L-alanyl-D-glutamate--2,6-diaminopimelate ligase n=1 Tax=Lacibacterium aquatile TaxID=1168082 RepID=A0ABW5DRA3_9PROT